MTDMSKLRAYRGSVDWERPNPSRLNDTRAIQQKGCHPYQLLLRGEETIASGGRWTSPLETPWNAENAFPARNGRSSRPSDVGMSPPQGCGQVLAVHSPRRSAPGATPNGVGRGSPSPDRGQRGSLRDAIDCCIPKGC